MNGDRCCAPFAYRPGPPGPPDRPRAGPDVPGRSHRAEFQHAAGAARRDDPVRADHRQAGQPGHADPVRALPDRGGLRGRRSRRAGEDHPVDRVLPREGEQPDRTRAGPVRPLPRRGAASAEGPGHPARRGPEDRERGARQRLRHPRHHGGHPFRPAGPQIRLDDQHRPGEGRGGGGHAHTAPGLDRPLAADDLARPPGLPRPPARVRRVRAGRLCPSYGEGPTDPEIAAKLVKAGPFS